MKTQRNFLIKHYEYFEENGKLSHEYYYILEHRKFLWWSYWKEIVHTKCGYGDCYKTRTKFPTLEDAKTFVREVLCPELPRESRRETTVDEMVCINGKSKW